MKYNKLNYLLAGCLFFMASLVLNSCTKEAEITKEDPQSAIMNEDLPNIDVPTTVSGRTDCDGVDVHWSYHGDVAPAFWPDLCPEWDCDGKRQSPINIIPPRIRRKSVSLKFFWEDVPTKILNNGHTIEFEYEHGSSLWLNGRKYNLLQFHFHMGSEHTVKGKRFPAEIHFVSQNELTGKLVVIAVFVEEGAENDFFARFIEHFPHEEGEFESEEHLNASELLPSNTKHFWHYTGSLTTPPCSEIAKWVIMIKTVEASAEQLAEMRTLEVFDDNYRPTQSKGSRLVRAQ